MKSAAACAQHLGDDALVGKIKLFVKVLYVAAGGKSEITVTEDEPTISCGLPTADQRPPINYSTRFRIWQRSPATAFVCDVYPESLWGLTGKFGFIDTVLEPLAVEPSTDLFQWPNLEELNATYQENSSLSTEQTNSNTTICPDRGSEVSEDATASWSEGNSIVWALGPAAAVGGWNDGCDEADAEDTDEENDNTDDHDWDTDDSEETEYTDHEDDAEWSCPDAAADQ
ncbi:MAG: hypothetical protein Q9205_003461 [Flavoplaca limonia]